MLHFVFWSVLNAPSCLSFDRFKAETRRLRRDRLGALSPKITSSKPPEIPSDAPFTSDVCKSRSHNKSACIRLHLLTRVLWPFSVTFACSQSTLLDYIRLYMLQMIYNYNTVGRMSAFRRLQDGTTCDACGRKFSSHTRLTRHFRSVPQCAETLAAQRRWTPAQPAMGSRTVADQLPYDSMILYIDTAAPTLAARQGWAMTEATMEALRLVSIIDWTQFTTSHGQGLRDALCQLPLHHTEFDEIMDAQYTYHAGQETALASRTLRWNSALTTAFVHARHIRKLHLNRITLPILDSWPFWGEAYSGSRQSALSICLTLICWSETSRRFSLCHCRHRRCWRSLSIPNIIGRGIGPCQGRLAVSRWRQLEDGSGPRPVRSTEDLFRLIWSLTPLRIREHPRTATDDRWEQALAICAPHDGSPCSIWYPWHSWASVCPGCKTYRCSSVSMASPDCPIDEKTPQCGPCPHQTGLLRSPQPKANYCTFMIVGTLYHRREMLTVPYENQTTTKLPPPLGMERTKKGFSTMPLKRYPHGLCTALAKMIHCGAHAIPTLSTTTTDEIYEIAEHFQTAYEVTREGEDGNDFFSGLNGKRSRCDH